MQYLLCMLLFAGTSADNFLKKEDPTFFEIMDSDHDSFISKDDIARMKETLLKKKDSMQSLSDPEKILIEFLSSPKGLPLLNNWEKVDLDKDGRVSQKELRIWKRQIRQKDRPAPLK